MNKKVKCLAVVGALFLNLIFGVVFGRVYADSNSMTISPPNQSIILVPGEKYTNSLNIFNANDSTRDLKYEISVGSFSQKNDNGKDDYGTVDLVSESSYNQIMDWITFNKTSGTVSPNKSDDVVYTIDVPEDAPAGGQYATIVVTDVTTSSASEGGNINIDQSFQFASIIYAEVAGETREEGLIKENAIPSFLLSGPLQATSMVRNNGNVHTEAKYTLQVWPLFSDEEICTNEENPETSLVLPETERYHAQTCELPMVGIFKAKQTVQIFGEVSVVERTVIMCPVWLLFIIIFVIIMLIIWIFAKTKRKKNSRAAHQDSEE
ncbi:hypothetical protein J5491_02830 [Candidatus Saccharibacteria bacterium]|nr:hypothetical protein [Candidatus Saccharibacteria bacterium]